MVRSSATLVTTFKTTRRRNSDHDPQYLKIGLLPAFAQCIGILKSRKNYLCYLKVCFTINKSYLSCGTQPVIYSWLYFNYIFPVDILHPLTFSTQWTYILCHDLIPPRRLKKGTLYLFCLCYGTYPTNGRSYKWSGRGNVLWLTVHPISSRSHG